MDTSRSTTRALTVVDDVAPYAFRIWLYGEWGFEANGRLSALLSGTPTRSGSVNLDCRRITVVDGRTMGTMSAFAGECAQRGVGVTFECDDDPVQRLIALSGLKQLAVAHRPLRARTAGRYHL